MNKPASSEMSDGPDWMRRLVVGAVTLVVLFLVYLVAAAVVPRWWAQRVADVVDGRLTVGALFGLFIGISFTVLPLAVAGGMVKWRSSKRGWVGWLVWTVVVLVCALPNIMTGAIVFGRSNAAHAGERILDVDGPGFRMWSLIGIIIGVLIWLGIWWLLRSRRSAKEKLREATADEG